MEHRHFNELTGQEETIRFLQNSIKNDKVSHAYIFSGERGSGKKLLSSIFAATLLCEKGGTDTCGECLSCRKAFTENHPDIIYVVHEKPELISVEEIREQVVDTIRIKPFESRYKIYIIDDAQMMNPQAQNALLKVIEEPPEYAVIILLATNSSMLLPTIESRCVEVTLRMVSDEQLKEFLLKNYHIPESEATVITSYARGNIGKAKQAVHSEDFGENLRKSLKLLTDFEKMTPGQCVSRAMAIAKDKKNIYNCLEIMTLWFRDVMVFKATRDVDTLTFRSYITDISRRADKISYEGIEIILKAIDAAKTRIKANVRTETVMELLFLTILEQ